VTPFSPEVFGSQDISWNDDNIPVGNTIISPYLLDRDEWHYSQLDLIALALSPPKFPRIKSSSFDKILAENIIDTVYKDLFYKGIKSADIWYEIYWKSLLCQS